VQKVELTLKRMIRELHIATPVYPVMCILGKHYPANREDFLNSGLPGLFDHKLANTRMRLPTPETWETMLSALGNKSSTWETLLDNRKVACKLGEEKKKKKKKNSLTH
jgi:telomerase protein component 1